MPRLIIGIAAPLLWFSCFAHFRGWFGQVGPGWMPRISSSEVNHKPSIEVCPNNAVIGWLLDSDPSIRWQVMRDLTETSAESVAAERARVVSEGRGKKLLDQQRPDGQWGDGPLRRFGGRTCTPWFSGDLGVDPMNERAQMAIDLVRSKVTWGPGFGDSPFFEGEVEPCINGRVLALGAYFGERCDRVVETPVRRTADGWWLELRGGTRLHPVVV